MLEVSSELLHLIFPMLLTIFDDYLLANKIAAASCLLNLVNKLSPTELKWFQFVLLQALKKSLHYRETPLLHPVLQILIIYAYRVLGSPIFTTSTRSTERAYAPSILESPLTCFEDIYESVFVELEYVSSISGDELKDSIVHYGEAVLALIPGMGIFNTRYIKRMYLCVATLLESECADSVLTVLGCKLVRQFMSTAPNRLSSPEHFASFYRIFLVAYARIVLRENHASDREKMSIKQITHAMKHNLQLLISDFSTQFGPLQTALLQTILFQSSSLPELATVLSSLRIQ